MNEPRKAELQNDPHLGKPVKGEELIETTERLATKAEGGSSFSGCAGGR